VTLNNTGNGTVGHAGQAPVWSSGRAPLAAVALVTGLALAAAGLGVFGVTGYGAGTDSAFGKHRGLDFAMSAVAVIILVVALIARPERLPLALAGLLALGNVAFLYASPRWRS